jgi:hypothetical protein
MIIDTCDFWYRGVVPGAKTNTNQDLQHSVILVRNMMNVMFMCRGGSVSVSKDEDYLSDAVFLAGCVIQSRSSRL